MKLLIIGAGGHGQCCHEIAERMNYFEEISFLDDHSRYEMSDMVVGKINQLEELRDKYDSVFVALGNNKLRKELYIRAKNAGYNTPSLIDPTAFVSTYCFVGEGTVIFPNAVLETHCHVARGCIISSNATIHREAKVNEFTVIHSNTVIRPKSYVGAMTTIGSQCTVSYGAVIKEHSEISEGSVVNVSREMIV